MRTREAFRDALHKLAATQIAQTEPPAFTFLPGPHPTDAAPAGSLAAQPYASPAPAAGGRTIAGATRALAAGETSAHDLVTEAYDAIERRSEELNAFTYVVPRAEAEREARLLD